MNDNPIINIISKIHFILASALSFIFLIFFTLFILLQNGVYLENISISNVKVDRLYIKWNEKINLLVEEVKISKQNSSSVSQINYLQINKLLEKLQLFDSWFEQVSIEKINYNNIKASFRYVEGKDGFLLISSKKFSLSSKLSFKSNLLRIHIDKLKYLNEKIYITGDLVLNNTNILELSSSLHININNDARFDIYALANEKKLYYKINSLQDIKSIKYIVNALKLDKRVQYWVDDAVSMKNLSIKSANGFILYTKINKALKNLHIKAVVDSLDYVYNKNIDAVTTKYTNLEFKNGVLFIQPQDTHSYGFDLNKSWLKIDFTKKAEILTLHLLFDGMLNKDMLHILSTYKIKIPFLQKEGIINTNLRLIVNLRTLDVDAMGKFTTKEAKINYLGLDIDVFDTDVFLNNFDVKVKDMHAKYKNIASADVDLNFNAKSSFGTMDFNFKKIFLKEQSLNLAQDSLDISYHISPAQDYININNSTWKYLDKTLSVDKLKVPFDLKKLTAQIPLSNLKIEKIANMNLTGEVVISPMSINLDIDLKELDFKGIKLNKQSTSLKLNLSNQLIISSKDTIFFEVNDKNLSLSNLDLNITDDILLAKDIYINYNDMFFSTISTSFNLNTNDGLINIHDIDIKDDKLGNIFTNHNGSIIKIAKKKESLFLRSSEFDIDYILSKEGWNLKLNSLSKVSKNSDVLQKYNLKEGNLNIYKNNKNQNINFLSNLKYPYKILVNNNIPITNYIINGSKNTKNITLNINQSVDVVIDDKISIKAKNIGIDINEMIKVFDNKKESKENTGIEISATGNNCYIYFSKQRHAISDYLEVHYEKGILRAQVMHKKGIAWFELKNNKFRLHGNNFDYEFMQELFALSRFEKGSLEFSIFGTPNNYDGIIYMQDTIIHDYVLLNNVLAFVNTIPSLITFSLPGYSKNGLFIDNAYSNFKYKNDIYNINNISLNSKELSILGKGTANIKKNTINLDLNLKTDLGSSLSKVPLVGYILLGKDTISTSLKINGKLDDPTINTRVAQDIAVAPLNIIKRTFLLPFNLFTDK